MDLSTYFAQRAAGRAAYQGTRLVGHCDCVPGFRCGLCVALDVDPPETRAQRAERQRGERKAAKAEKRGAWLRRLDRYASFVEGTDA